jgi:nucleotide-binding universal stress UspA family protein
MNNILLAIDDTKGSLRVVERLTSLFGDCAGNTYVPPQIILLYVERLEGSSLMDETIVSPSEIATLKTSLKGTAHQEKMNHKANKILDFFLDMLQRNGFSGIEPLVRQGHPAEEILKTAQEKEVEMIIMGSRGKRLQNLWMGSISREVANNAPVSVLIAK